MDVKRITRKVRTKFRMSVIHGRKHAPVDIQLIASHSKCYRRIHSYDYLVYVRKHEARSRVY